MIGNRLSLTRKGLLRSLLVLGFLASGLAITATPAEASHTCQITLDPSSPYYVSGPAPSTASHGFATVTSGCTGSVSWKTQLQMNSHVGYVTADWGPSRITIPGETNEFSGASRSCTGGTSTTWRSRILVTAGASSTFYQYNTTPCNY